MTEKYLKFHPEIVKESPELNLKKVEAAIAAGADDPLSRDKANKMIARYIAYQSIDYLNGNDGSSQGWLQRFAKHPLLQVQARYLMEDLPSMAFFSVMAAYHRAQEKKVYVIQESFFKKFEEVNLDKMQWRHLPQNLAGFVQMPYAIDDGTATNNMFDSFYFYCGPSAGIERHGFLIDRKKVPLNYNDTDMCICIGYTDTTEQSSNYCFRSFPIDLSLSVKETFVGVSFIENNGMGMQRNRVHEEGYLPHYAVMVNLLAYLKSGDPDLREFKNKLTYRGNSTTKPVRADAELSRESLVLVGFDYLKERSLVADEWYSMPHFGWRWCGPERTELKLAYVKGSTKQWKNKEIQHGQEEADHV